MYIYWNGFNEGPLNRSYINQIDVGIMRMKHGSMVLGSGRGKFVF